MHQLTYYNSIILRKKRTHTHTLLYRHFVINSFWRIHNRVPKNSVRKSGLLKMSANDVIGIGSWDFDGNFAHKKNRKQHWIDSEIKNESEYFWLWLLFLWFFLLHWFSCLLKSYCSSFMLIVELFNYSTIIP